MDNLLAETGVGNLLVVAGSWLFALYSLRSMRPEARRMLMETAGGPMRFVLAMLLAAGDGLFRWVPRMPDFTDVVVPCQECARRELEASEVFVAQECLHPDDVVMVTAAAERYCGDCGAFVQPVRPPAFSSQQEADAWLAAPVRWESTGESIEEPF